nr:reverse transcriptase domain-containing protein [Tanacetum cinerariifolium]
MKMGKITMDLVTKLPKSSSGYAVIWVIVDGLTNSAHFLPVREDYKMKKLARIYINKIVARHDIQVPLEEMKIDENLRSVEEPIKIVARDVKKLKRRRIPLVKVRWNSRHQLNYGDRSSRKGNRLVYASSLKQIIEMAGVPSSTVALKQ